MANYDPYTENLADFGSMELAEAADLLKAFADGEAPDDFYDEGVRVAFNRNSGYVFLTNDEYQTCMINPNTGKLELWHFTPYAGHEGFLDDLVEEYKEDPDDWDEDDIEYLREYGAEI